LAEKVGEALMETKVRGTCSTAVTKLILDNDFETVKEKVRKIKEELR